MHDTTTWQSDTAARALAMAVVLFAGVGAGLLLTAADDGGFHGTSTVDRYASAETVIADNVVSDMPDEALCHEFAKDVVIAGHAETIYGTACRQPDGTWDVVP